MRRVIRDTSQYLNRLRRDDRKDVVKNVLGVNFHWPPSLTVPIVSISGTTGVIAETPVSSGTSGLVVVIPTISGSAGTS
jgi:hypothetical protein